MAVRTADAHRWTAYDRYSDYRQRRQLHFQHKGGQSGHHSAAVCFHVTGGRFDDGHSRQFRNEWTDARPDLWPRLRRNLPGWGDYLAAFGDHQWKLDLHLEYAKRSKRDLYDPGACQRRGWQRGAHCIDHSDCRQRRSICFDHGLMVVVGDCGDQYPEEHFAGGGGKYFHLGRAWKQEYLYVWWQRSTGVLQMGWVVGRWFQQDLGGARRLHRHREGMGPLRHDR